MSKVDPVGAGSKLSRILRGGGLEAHTATLRCASRYAISAHLRYSSVGFRCVRTLKP